MKTLTRRRFGKTLAGTAIAAMASSSLSRLAFAQLATPALLQFPPNFLWGCATASYQIEGAVKEDGRKPSVWDTFSHTPGKTFHGETGDVADDSYHLYKEDVQLLKNLGAKVYRFSISWSRVFPDGTGQPNPKGLDYYQRVVDELLKNNIDPYITLFHWDLPQALPGGWQSRDTSKAFGDYAAYISKHLSDRVGHFFTTNEFTCFTDLGYKTGKFAPGLKLHDAQVNQIRHHAVLAHGLAVQAIRANGKSGTQIGLAENATVYVPVIEDYEQIEAARRATREGNAPFLTAVLEGKYTEGYLQREGANAPKVEPGDMKIYRQPARFRRSQRLHARVCPRRFLPGWLRRGKAPVFRPAHGLGLAVHRPGSNLLGDSQRQRHLETEGSLHHRKRLLRRRCANRERTRRGHRPRDVSAQSPHPPASRRLRRLPHQRLFPLEPAR
jgi:beta-glucosidase